MKCLPTEEDRKEASETNLDPDGVDVPMRAQGPLSHQLLLLNGHGQRSEGHEPCLQCRYQLYRQQGNNKGREDGAEAGGDLGVCLLLLFLFLFMVATQPSS